MKSHAKQEGKSERERGEELVEFIQDAARKRRLRQAEGPTSESCFFG